MLAAKRMAGVTPEVNLRQHVTCTPPPSVNNAAHSGNVYYLADGAWMDFHLCKMFCTYK